VQFRFRQGELLISEAMLNDGFELGQIHGACLIVVCAQADPLGGAVDVLGVRDENGANIRVLRAGRGHNAQSIAMLQR